MWLWSTEFHRDQLALYVKNYCSTILLPIYFCLLLGQNGCIRKARSVIQGSTHLLLSWFPNISSQYMFLVNTVVIAMFTCGIHNCMQL